MLNNPNQCPDRLGIIKELNRLTDEYKALGCDDDGPNGGKTIPDPSTKPRPSENDERLKQAARITAATAVAIIVTIITKVPVPIPVP
jgi:hypothetical protein